MEILFVSIRVYYPPCIVYHSATNNICCFKSTKLYCMCIPNLQGIPTHKQIYISLQAACLIYCSSVVMAHSPAGTYYAVDT